MISRKSHLPLNRQGVDRPTSFLVGSLAAVIAAALLIPIGAGLARNGGRPVEDKAQHEIDSDHIAAFTLEGVSSVGGTDPLAERFLGYSGIVKQGDTWVSTYDVYDCSDRLADAGLGCSATNDSVTIESGVRDGEMIIGHVEGPLDEDQRESLLSWVKDAADQVSQRASYSYNGLVVRDSDRGTLMVGSRYWIGATPSSLAAECRYEFRDRAGELVWASDSFTNYGPQVEAGRDGNVIGGGFPEPVTSDLAATVNCTDYIEPATGG